ncbi:hypothetical protein [Qipengyuania sediminis]|uniref:hypothetical protein n=1 Tax=Qipengyuania sediminis TaxID=1532023 RepID=UPI00105954E4|nr:hypothetical protein [Qipengyuania sediminis]
MPRPAAIPAARPLARRSRAAAAPPPAEAEAAAAKAQPIPTNWRARFLAHLGETSNVTAAARHAKVPLHVVYKHRRTDPAFRGAWFAALAEGYDNLEMELLQHLRGKEEEGEAPGASAAKRKFDTATAFRCLTAHRESVAREKGRRTLADEVATIAAINEKIDRLRLNAKASDQAVRKARKTVKTASAEADHSSAREAAGR